MSTPSPPPACFFFVEQSNEYEVMKINVAKWRKFKMEKLKVDKSNADNNEIIPKHKQVQIITKYLMIK